MKKREFIPIFVVLTTVAILLAQQPQAGQDGAKPQQLSAQNVEFKGGKSGQLADLDVPEPESFVTKDGRKGWKIKIPGGRPLATPAVVGGILYIGGGFGSHEFYALDAETGKRVWTFKTGDDGPTAAVAAEDCVAYNTESCTIYVHDARTGKVLWDKWLGDPLMSQPAIGGGRLFMAYPGKGGHHLAAFELKTGKVLWDQQIDSEVITAPVLHEDFCYVATCNGTLYCFDQAGGTLYWKKECSVTSAPVIVGKKAYFSQRQVKTIETTEGQGAGAKKIKSETTLEGFNAADSKSGEFAFVEPQSAVKAGFLLSLDRGREQFLQNKAANESGQKVMIGLAGKSGTALKAASQPGGGLASIGAEEVFRKLEDYKKKSVSDKPEDGIKAAAEGLALADELDTVASKLQAKPGQEESAKDLKKAAGELRAQADKVKDAAETAQNIAVNLKAADKEVALAKKHDASVAFASAPEAAQLNKAAGNIGQANVKSVWAYQGSRLLPAKDGFIVIQGDRFCGLSQSCDKVAWENKLASKVDATRPGSPPAMAGGKIYFGTADGRVVCSDPQSGKTLWENEVGGHIIFQPAVMGGRIYIATDNGILICLEAGDKQADGWGMWGGSARHNGPVTPDK